MNAAHYSIRDGRPEDAEHLLEVHRRAILELGAAAYTLEETRSWAAKLVPLGYVRAMTEGNEVFEVAVDENDAVIAFVSVTDNEVMALYVSPERARAGIASALLVRAEQRIRSAGFDTIVIGAALSGLPFYLARGYQIEAETSWETRGGLTLEVATVRKAL